MEPPDFPWCRRPGADFRVAWGHTVEENPAAAGVAFHALMSDGWSAASFRVKGSKLPLSALCVRGTHPLAQYGTVSSGPPETTRFYRWIWVVSPRPLPDLAEIALSVAREVCETPGCTFTVLQTLPIHDLDQLHAALAPTPEPTVLDENAD